MFKINPKQIILKQPSKYDIPGFTNPERRKEILQNTLYLQPKFCVKGGTSKNNPYKHTYDVILAERRELHEYYKNSILWSPKYTPWHFKNYFLYPALCVAFLMFYIRYIATPKKMMRLRKKGYDFPTLEAKGWLEGWIEDEEDEDYDEFAEAKQGLQGYKDWTIKDLENFDRKQEKHNQPFEIKPNSSGQQGGNNRLLNTKIKNMRNKMQDQLDQAIQTRQELGLTKN
ncbi:hypothetical protein ABPG72_004159 [Tetrahymena utriculariae]